MKSKPSICHSCVYYYITWDTDFPYGCHAMGFKTRRNPGLQVRQAMNGQPCLMYSPKKPTRHPSKSKAF
jgi:hypothetical protein